MIQVYRIAAEQYSDDLSGTGAGIAGGRWNRPGLRVLYTSSSRALATLEVLVHIPLVFVPRTYFLLTLHLPEDSLRTVPLDQLPPGRDGPEPPPTIRDVTENWLTDNQFLVLKVPSAVVAGEYNLLVNPAHARSAEVRIVDKQPFRFDARLLR